MSNFIPTKPEGKKPVSLESKDLPSIIDQLSVDRPDYYNWSDDYNPLCDWQKANALNVRDQVLQIMKTGDIKSSRSSSSMDRSDTLTSSGGSSQGTAKSKLD